MAYGHETTETLPDPAVPERKGTEAARSQHAFDLIASGIVRSRADLRERLGVSPSTAGGIVSRLLSEGRVTEDGIGTSTGGRPPRILRAVENQNVVAVAELGARHARIGLVSTVGTTLAVEVRDIAIDDGPAGVLAEVSAGWAHLLEQTPKVGHLIAAGVGLPGPVDAHSGEVVAPARMPGWHGARVGELLTTELGVPVIVENDARAGALGELALRAGALTDFIYVKAGNGIGAALVSEGRLVTGASGVAGDITHVTVPGGQQRPCACGRIGCLETVASGRAIRDNLQQLGVDTSSMTDLVELARAFHPAATAAIRQSGQHVGDVLAPLVNFLNPAAVLLGGSLSGVDAFVAAVRSALYGSALAMTTQSLLIESGVGGADSALIGLAQQATRRVGA